MKKEQSKDTQIYYSVWARSINYKNFWRQHLQNRGLLKLTLHHHLPKSNYIFPENPVCLSVIVLRGAHMHIDFLPQRKPNDSLKVWGVWAVSLLVQWNPCSDFSYFPRTKQRALQIVGDGSWEKRSILSAVRSHSGDNILMEELGCEFSTWLKEKCPVSGSSHRDGF